KTGVEGGLGGVEGEEGLHLLKCNGLEKKGGHHQDGVPRKRGDHQDGVPRKRGDHQDGVPAGRWYLFQRRRRRRNMNKAPPRTPITASTLPEPVAQPRLGS